MDSQLVTQCLPFIVYVKMWQSGPYSVNLKSHACVKIRD